MGPELIGQLGLEPLVGEGGWFRQTWRSPEEVSGRPAGTAIVALFGDTPDGFSALHRLPSTEVWHFHLGDPFELLLLEPGGGSEVVVLGPALGEGQVVQVAVPGGVWMGGRPAAAGGWTLVVCTMAPGFVDGDFEAGDGAALARAYPSRSTMIERLTRGFGRG